MVSGAGYLSRLRAEDGSVIVTATIVALCVVVLGAVVVQVGDWFQHRRHLQLRADAAAFAAGPVFNECFDSINYTTDQATSDIENTARQYSGFASPTGPSYNTQFGSGSDSIVFQSSTYPGGGGGGPDDTPDGVAPCSNLQLDVKLTQQSIASLFSFLPFATTHAHARVELQSIRSAKGSFPLAIPDTNPKQVSVTFVDETAGGTELTGCTGVLAGTSCTFLLSKGAGSGGLTPWSATAAVKIPNEAGHLLGVRVGMGGAVKSCAGVSGTANSSCWDGSSVNQGLVEIRDYDTAGSGVQPNPPVLYGVWPAGACSGSPFFSDMSLTGGATSCGVGVQAEVNFGTGSTDPTKPKSQGGVAAKVTATVAGGSKVQLQPVSYNAATGAWLWATANAGSVAVDTSGSTSTYPVALAWEEQDGSQGGKTCKTSGNPCTGSFGTVQHVTSATDGNDGPIKLMTLAEAAAAMPPYSLTAGMHTLTVTVGLRSALGAQVPPQLTALRLTGSGSRTTGVNCDGTGNSDFTDAIVSGCKTTYQINDSAVCPDPAPPAGAPDCVPLKTGNLGSTVPSALNTRFGNTCPAATDPRRDLLMMLTDPSALSGSGKTEIPVTNFADFHVVGWSGGPGSCGTWPFPGSEPSGGNLWGYFLKYTAPSQQPSGQKCQLDDITPCVAVLTR
jgi:hypothetical protein